MSQVIRDRSFGLHCPLNDSPGVVGRLPLLPPVNKLSDELVELLSNLDTFPFLSF